jgi:hypothetical protein
MSIGNALQNFRAELVKVDVSEREESSTTNMRLRKLNLHHYPSMPVLRLLLLEFGTFAILACYRWAEFHFWHKSNSYFIEFWFENLFVFSGIYLLSRNSSAISGLKTLYRDLWPLLGCHLVLTINYCMDFKTFTRKSSGTEYYQFNQILIVPVVLGVIHGYCNSNIPLKVNYVVCLLLSWKLSILYHDIEFRLSFTSSLMALLIALIHGFFIIMLKERLNSYSVWQIAFALTSSIIVVLPIFILLQHSSNTISGVNFNMQKFLNTAFMALLKMAGLSTTLILLKQNHPLMAILTTRCVSIPDNFVQALIYKLDCVLSASKVCILTGLEYVVLHIHYIFCQEPCLNK